MPSNNGDQELRDARKQITDQFLGGHLEKHELEQEGLKNARRADQEAVRTALDAEKQRDDDHRIAHHAAHEAHKDQHDITAAGHAEQHIAEHRAVEAAQASIDKRLDQMNEFRDQLRDQAATFVRRESLEAFVSRYEKAHDEVLALVATEREERRSNEGSHALIHRGEEGVKKGLSSSVAIIVGAITLAVTILGAVILVANFATGTP